jgi:hypothetical protein
MTQDMVSFVLRFVRETGEEQETRWRGIIKHVQSNDETHFSRFAEALEFMQAHVNDVVNKSFSDAAESQRENPFLETTRLWGEYMPQYTQLMFDTVKETMTTPFAGTPMAQQVEDAFLKTWASWGVRAPKEQEQTADQLESLLAQLAALQDTVKELEAQIARKEETVSKDEAATED